MDSRFLLKYFKLGAYMSRSLLILVLVSMLVSCTPPSSMATPIENPPKNDSAPTGTHLPISTNTASVNQTPVLSQQVPQFEHIVLILFENKKYESVIGNSSMPVYNHLAQENTVLTQYYAVGHPSLPNYLALIGGDTFKIKNDCIDCFINAPSLPDLIETSGRTWKTYQENMPQPCYLGNKDDYAQKHNPFVYFDPIRMDQERCERSVVPLTDLSADILAGALPNFIFISPNLCNDAHDCSLDVADAWLGNLLDTLIPALEASTQPYLIVPLFDEGHGDGSCCGLPEDAGGRIPIVLVSPSVKSGFQDDTPYTHYSLLKTIAEAWGLNFLGHAADESNVLITAPWK